MATSSTGSWNPPSLFYLEKPDGTLVAVDGSGGELKSPPDLQEVSSDSLGFDSDVGTLVVDQWGRIIVPLYPPGSFGVAVDGSPANEPLNPYGSTPAEWPPDAWPPDAGGLPSSCPPLYNASYSPGSHNYWIDPTTGQPVLVAGDGSPETSLPMIQEIDGKVIDQWGNEIEPLWPPADLGIDETGSPTGGSTMPEGFIPPQMTYWEDPTTGKYVAVDNTGTPLTSPPAITAIDGKVVDQWGNELKSYWPPANLGIDEKGNPTAGPTMPEGFTPPQMTYWQDPTTGQYVAVDNTGTPLTSPPAITAIDGKVVDQWGNELKSYWPPANLGIDEKGNPTAGPTMPEGFTPPQMTYWQDPTTGQYVAVDNTGTPLTSPPAITAIDGKVVDQWGNELKSYWPPANLGIDEKGNPTAGPTMPDGFTPPTMRYWEDPATGQIVAVDETGTPLASPPQLTTVSGEMREALGYPPGQYELVVDQWGNPVIPMNPPGNYGLDEFGYHVEDAGEIPPWPPDEWPPGSGESDQIADLDEEGVMFSAEELEPVSGLETAVQPDSATVPLDGAEAVTPDLEPMSADLGETQSADASDSYSGVQMTEGEVALDDDFNSESTMVDELVTAGLDAPTGRETVADQVAEVDDVGLVSTEVDGLLTAGLDASESAVEDVALELTDVGPEALAESELKVVEPAEEIAGLPTPIPQPEIRVEEAEQTAEVVETAEEISGLPTPLPQPEFKVEEAEQTAEVAEPAEEISGLPTPLPQPEFKVEEADLTAEVVETEMKIDDIADLSLPKLTEIVEETTALEPIEIVVESLDVEPLRGVSAAEESSDRITADESEEEEPDLEA